MISAFATQQARISAGGSLSPIVSLGSGNLVALLMPAAFTGNALTFQVSIDGGQTAQNFYQGGNEYETPVGPSRYVSFPDDVFAGFNWVAVRSGTAEAPVNQSVDAVITLIGSNVAVFPNPRRTLVAAGPGNIGTWPAMLSSETDVLTLDLSGILGVSTIDGAETISSIIEFVLTPIGPYGVVDQATGTRALATPSIEGSLVSQHFGAWQDIPAIQYRVDIQVETSRGDTPAFYGFLNVTQAPN